MIRINRYYSGTNGDMDADPKWFVKSWDDFVSQTNHEYDNLVLKAINYKDVPVTYLDSNSIIETMHYRCALFRVKYGELEPFYSLYFYINADTKEEVIKFLTDGNISIMSKT